MQHSSVERHWTLVSVLDGPLITGQNPASSTATALALLKLVGAERVAA